MAPTPVFPVRCTKPQSQAVAYKRTAPQRRFFFARRLGLGRSAGLRPSLPCRCTPFVRCINRLSSRPLIDFLLCSSQNIEWLHVEVVGKIRKLRKEARYCAFQQAIALLAFLSARYSSDVAAHSAIGLGNPSSCATALPSQFLAVVRLRTCVMAAVRGTPSGVPVSLTPGLPTCAQLPPNSLGNEKWQLLTSRS